MSLDMIFRLLMLDKWCSGARKFNHIMEKCSVPSLFCYLEIYILLDFIETCANIYIVQVYYCCRLHFGFLCSWRLILRFLIKFIRLFEFTRIFVFGWRWKVQWYFFSIKVKYIFCFSFFAIVSKIWNLIQ